jgi:hypothetical protein
MEAISGIPFPYDKAEMPPVPKVVKGSWVEETMHRYIFEGTEKALRDELLPAYEFSKKNNVQVWCGEMGVYNKYARNSDRIHRYKTVSALLEKYNIPFTMWNYKGAFGVYKKDTGSEYPYDLDTKILQANDFIVPVGAGIGSSHKTISVDIPLTLYDDLQGKNIHINEGGSENTKLPLHFLCTADPAEGIYCIRWGNCRRYGSLNFLFMNGADFSSAVLQGAVFSFQIRSS